MYEIYINDRPLRLIASKDLETNRPADTSTSSSANSPKDQLTNRPIDSSTPNPASSPKESKTNRPTDQHLLARYTGKAKTLLHYADLLEKGSPKVTEVTIHYPDLDQLWADFQTHYKLVSAAGGVVNLKGTDTYLFIFRRGCLDLPKGKIDPGETIEQAALREVEEETGVYDLKIISPPNNKGKQFLNPQFQVENCKSATLHTYRSKKGKRILKPTYWYAMETDQIELVPQAEEDIDWARWMTIESGLDNQFVFYPSLRKLLMP